MDAVGATVGEATVAVTSLRSVVHLLWTHDIGKCTLLHSNLEIVSPASISLLHFHENTCCMRLTTSKQILSLNFLHMNEIDSSINCWQYFIARLCAKLLQTVVLFTCSANTISYACLYPSPMRLLIYAMSIVQRANVWVSFNNSDHHWQLQICANKTHHPASVFHTESWEGCRGL